MQKTKINTITFFKNFSLVILVAVFFFVGTAIASAATLQLNPSTGSYSAGQNINAVEATLKFDPSVVSVVSISKDGSAFSLWTVEPSFSNSAGTITFGGGSPSPFSATSNLVNITFRALKAGSASVSFTEASVLAADGQGTNVYQN